MHITIFCINVCCLFNMMPLPSLECLLVVLVKFPMDNQVIKLIGQVVVVKEEVEENMLMEILYKLKIVPLLFLPLKFINFGASIDGNYMGIHTQKKSNKINNK